MNGVILGRFLPPHNGHLYLIDFARSLVDHLYVLVCTLSSEPIPGEIRFQWMRELAPECTVIHITTEIPDAARGSAVATTIWADTIAQSVSEPIDRVFAAEEYGWELAHLLGAQFVPIDPGRHNIPVSATQIRRNPRAHWRYIPAVVRPWFIRHVALLDRQDQAKELAWELDTVLAPPYREFWTLMWNQFGGRREVKPLTGDDIRHALGANARALVRHSGAVMLHDLRSLEDLRDLAAEITLTIVVAEVHHHDDIARIFSDPGPLVITPVQATAEALPEMTGFPAPDDAG